MTHESKLIITHDGWTRVKVTKETVMIKQFRKMFDVAKWIADRLVNMTGRKQCHCCRRYWSDIEHGGIHLLITNGSNCLMCDQCMVQFKQQCLLQLRLHGVVI